MGKRNRPTALHSAVRLALLGFAVGSTPAWAQDIDPSISPDLEQQHGQEQNSDWSPIHVIDRAMIDHSGHISVAELLDDLTSTGSALNLAFNNGGNGEHRVNLRNLGCSRALVLINNRRMTQGLTGCADLTTVSLTSVDRIEILTEGGSAIYGEGAISGVINIIMVSEYEGASANAQLGKFLDDGDGESQSFDVSMGANNDRASVYFNANYVQGNAVGAGDRTISREIRYGTGTAFGSSATPHGRIGFTNPSTGTFSSAWVPIPGCDQNAFGAQCFRVGDFSFGAPGSGGDRFNFAPDNFLLTPQERTHIFSSGRYDLTENISLHVDGAYNHRQSSQQLAPMPLFLGVFGSGPTAQIGVGALNPFNPAGRALRGSSWLLGRRMVEAGPRIFQQDLDNYRFGLGLSGEFQTGSRQWNWTLDSRYERNDRQQLTLGQVDFNRVEQALSDGCVTGAIAGCTPLNVFGGAGTITQAMLDFIGFVGQDRQVITSRGYHGNISGDLFDLPAGPLALALGYDYRSLSGSTQPDALIASGSTPGSATDPLVGSRKTNELYIQANVPLLSDLAWAHHLNLELAARHHDIETIGRVYPFAAVIAGGISSFESRNSTSDTSSSVALNWQPSKNFGVHARYSNDVNMASLAALFNSPVTSFPRIIDPCNGGAVANPGLPGCAGVPAGFQPSNLQTRATLGSNPALKPETSTSWNAGISYQPDWLTGLSVDLAAYEIEVEQAIQRVGAQTVVNLCAQTGAYCSFVARSAGGQIVDIYDGAINIGQRVAKGAEFSLQYLYQTEAIGSFTTRWDGNYLDQLSSQSLVANGISTTSISSNVVGQYNGSAYPRWRSNLTLSWQLGSFEAIWGMRYLHHLREPCDPQTYGGFTLPPGAMNGQQYCNLGPAVSGINVQRKLGSVTYHDIQVSYFVGDWDTRLTLGVRNIGDKGPPLSASASYNSFDGTTYDIPGRYPYIRITTDF